MILSCWLELRLQLVDPIMIPEQGNKYNLIVSQMYSPGLIIIFVNIQAWFHVNATPSLWLQAWKISLLIYFPPSSSSITADKLAYIFKMRMDRLFLRHINSSVTINNLIQNWWKSEQQGLWCTATMCSYHFDGHNVFQYFDSHFGN